MNNTKILIVEDEPIVALDIKMTLLNFGYEVTNYVSNYDDAIKEVTNNRPTMIFMDINLNNSKDGIETATAIQKIENIPIIYLTSYSDENTITRAIQTNPINYILKPFKREDLNSAVLLCLYKIDKLSKTVTSDDYSYLGFDYYFDSKNEILLYKNLPINLGLKEKKLLSILVASKGNIVPFSEIEYMLWPDAPVSHSTLRTVIYRLRAKMEYKIIVTVASIGCKIINPFT